MMKKIFLLLAPASLLLFSCNNETGTAGNTNSDTTNASVSKAPANLPYVVDRTPDWEIGDGAHVAVAMNTLKGYELNVMTAVASNLADSVEFYADGVSFKGSKDSLVQMISTYRKGYDTVMIKMHDYESVKSKSRGEEWVGLWYTEINQPKGKAVDSFMVMDDIKIVNGKVAVIDTKGRRLAKK